MPTRKVRQEAEKAVILNVSIQALDTGKKENNVNVIEDVIKTVNAEAKKRLAAVEAEDNLDHIVLKLRDNVGLNGQENEKALAVVLFLKAIIFFVVSRKETV